MKLPKLPPIKRCDLLVALAVVVLAALLKVIIGWELEPGP